MGPEREHREVRLRNLRPGSGRWKAGGVVAVLVRGEGNRKHG
jgi:hypothetical protein